MALAAVGTDISDDDRMLLKQWVRAQMTPQSVALRARIVLKADEGQAGSVASCVEARFIRLSGIPKPYR